MAKLEREIPGMKLRLMGLRCTNLVSTKKGGIDFFGTGERSKALSPTNPSARKTEDEDEWEVWPENEFEEAARLEREDDMNELAQLSQEREASEPATETTPIRSKRKALDNLLEDPDLDAAETSPNQQQQQQNPRSWSCPICTRSQPGNDDKAFNAHIDYCLSRQTIKEAVRAISPTPSSLLLPSPSSTTPDTNTSPLLAFAPRAESKGRGTGRPRKRKSAEAEGEGKKQQVLFGGR
jgi:DNA polymerase kappa